MFVTQIRQASFSRYVFHQRIWSRSYLCFLYHSCHQTHEYEVLDLSIDRVKDVDGSTIKRVEMSSLTLR